jgi:hypothetical protein
MEKLPDGLAGTIFGKEGYPTIVLEALADNKFLFGMVVLDGQVHAMI